MQKRAFLVLSLMLVIACGQTPAQSVPVGSSTEAAAPTADKLLVARADGLSVVEVASGKILRELPPGITSADRSAHYVVETGSADTLVRAVDPSSGAELKQVVISGTFELPIGYGPRADALSRNGAFLVLGDPTGSKSGFVVLDTTNMTEKARIDLEGSFTFDAIDEQALSLYVLEHPRPDSHLYNVRLVDLSTGLLNPRAIVDQKASSPSAEQLARGTMGGIYHSSMTVGSFHFGFYTHPTKGPVIHSLHLADRWARCLIDLGLKDTHKAQWAIVAAPREESLYVINAASGVFASVNTRSLRVDTRQLAVEQAPERDRRGSAVVSPDGSRLYATGGNGIMVIEPRTMALRGQYLRDREFSSVMVSSDGTRLYALGTDGAISRVEANTGRDLGVVAHLPAAVSLLRVE